MIRPREVATRSLNNLAILNMGFEGNFAWNIPQDAIRGLHVFEAARPALEAYLNLSDAERNDLELFVGSR